MAWDHVAETTAWYRYRLPQRSEGGGVECGAWPEGLWCFPEQEPPLETLPVPPTDETLGYWTDTQVYVSKGDGKGRLVQASEDRIDVWKERGVARTWDREVVDPGPACGAAFVPGVVGLATVVTDDDRMHVVASIRCRPVDEAAQGFDVLVDFFEACPE